MPQEPLDEIDLRILHTLQGNARITNQELAQAVGLSPSPCSRRVRALVTNGVIRDFVTLIDPPAVGLQVSIFVNVTLERQVESNLDTFEQHVRQYPEVMECHLMTGDSDYLLRVVTRDVGGYERFIKEKLTRVPGVASIKSSFALRQVVYRTALPLEGELPGAP